jgi:small nuclear ribonucleoprotein E
MKTQPINLLFRLFQNKNSVLIIFHKNLTFKITGKISGFDEFMNVVLENSFEINLKGEKKFIGNILIKGDCIGIISDSSLENEI